MTQRPDTLLPVAAPSIPPSPPLLRVLAVDDDPSEFPLLERGFTLSGVPVLLSTATTAQIAVVSVLMASPEERPHVALVDITMPLINGFALVRQFRLDGLPAVMVSGLVDETRRQRAHEFGALGLLAKPSDITGYCAFACEVFRLAGHLAR